jgi:dihydrofolate reductase
VGVVRRIKISLIPVLLGEGQRLFEHLGSDRRRLEKIKVVDAPVRTDVRFRVLRA